MFIETLSAVVRSSYRPWETRVTGGDGRTDSTCSWLLMVTTSYSREDLEEILRSPAYFDAFFGTLPQTMAMYKEHEELLKANLEVTGKLLLLFFLLAITCNAETPAETGSPFALLVPCTRFNLWWRTLTAKNMALKERHEALKKETSDAFNDAHSLQHKWHNEIVPAQDEVYKVRPDVGHFISAIIHADFGAG